MGVLGCKIHTWYFDHQYYVWVYSLLSLWHKIMYKNKIQKPKTINMCFSFLDLVKLVEIVYSVAVHQAPWSFEGLIRSTPHHSKHKTPPNFHAFSLTQGRWGRRAYVSSSASFLRKLLKIYEHNSSCTLCMVGLNFELWTLDTLTSCHVWVEIAHVQLYTLLVIVHQSPGRFSGNTSWSFGFFFTDRVMLR